MSITGPIRHCSISGAEVPLVVIKNLHPVADMVVYVACLITPSSWHAIWPSAVASIVSAAYFSRDRLPNSRGSRKCRSCHEGTSVSPSGARASETNVPHPFPIVYSTLALNAT